MRRAEIGAALVAVLLLLAGLALNRAVPTHQPAAPVVATAATPLSEAWYCPVPTPQNLGSNVWTADLGGAPVHLRTTGFGTGNGAATSADLAAGLVGNQVAPAPAPAPASVEGFGQPIASYLTIVGSTTGAAAAPCSSQPGTHWLFATGSTAQGDDTYLYIANPFPEQAGVTIRVLSPNGDLVPAGLDNVQIPPSSQTTIYLADYYPETPSFGLDVTATRGRLVVDRLMQVAGQVRGLNLSLGVTAPSLQWIFPGGQTPANGTEYLMVANPAGHEALVNESFQTVDGAAPAGQQNIPVPAGSQVTLKLSDEVPAGTQHSTILSVSNGVPVVAERVTTEGSGSAQGYESVQGAVAAGTSWWVPAGSPAGGTDTLGVVNTSPVTATFGVSIVTGTATSAPPELASLQVGSGLRANVDLTPYLNGQPALLLVRASAGEIAVENDVALPSTYRETMETVGLPAG